MDRLFGEQALPLASLVSQAATARDSSARYLRSLQSSEGWWKGNLETNVTMDAEDLMLREFLSVRDENETIATAAWIRSHQRDDGTWANFYGGPGDLSTTVEAYVALRFAGDAPEAPHMVRAAAFILGAGGVESTRVFTRIWLSLFGLWSWEDLPAIPPEWIFVPPSVPLNIYEFGCWARQTVVALTVVASYRPVHRVGFDIDELRSGETPPAPPRSLRTWRGRFAILDALLRRYDRLARHELLRRTVREAALASAERWIVRRQEADGSWGGIQPPWVYSMLALHLRGYPNDHPLMAKAFEGLERFLVRGEGERWLEACQSPIWDTAFAMIALADSGASPDDEQLQRAASWLCEREALDRGDWALRRPSLAPGGWAFEFANRTYPDVDDTAEVVLALRRVAPDAEGKIESAITRAIRWTEGMASSDGAWGAFDADNVRQMLYELPFSDFGAVIDPPSADVTAHVIEMLASEPTASRWVIDRAIGWLRDAQESDGAWFGRWGVNYVYGVGAAVPALVRAGVPIDDGAIVRAVGFLEAHQNPDGGFGEDIRSYDDPTLRGFGASTASQTSWALLALIAAGKARSDAARRAVFFLCSTQREDGSWDEPWYTGTGFPGDFYINYHLYRLVFPVSALGRWCRTLSNSPVLTDDLAETTSPTRTSPERATVER